MPYYLFSQFHSYPFYFSYVCVIRSWLSGKCHTKKSSYKLMLTSSLCLVLGSLIILSAGILYQVNTASIILGGFIYFLDKYWHFARNMLEILTELRARQAGSTKLFPFESQTLEWTSKVPAEGFVNGLGFPTGADLAVLNLTTAYMPFGACMKSRRAV